MSNRNPAKPDQEAFKKTQLEIINFLFKRNAPARIEEICQVIKATKNEADYHIDRLAEQGFINSVIIPRGMTVQGEGTIWGFDVSSKGKAFVMEGNA